jgi:chromate transporter
MILVLWQLVRLFAVLSVLSVGGGNGVLPDMQNAAVDHYRWLTAHEFLDIFALSRAAPGPGSLIVALIGQRAAGPLGAIVATLAMFGPSCLIVHVAARLWGRTTGAPWRETAERALAPVAVGLTFAAGIALIRTTEDHWTAWAITAGATLLLAMTELHPLVAMSAGAVAMIVLGS